MGHPRYEAVSRTPLRQAASNDTVTSPHVASSRFYMTRERSVEINGEMNLLVQDSIIFSSPRHPDGLWGPPNLLYNGFFPWG
jgi:hypothetical protein